MKRFENNHNANYLFCDNSLLDRNIEDKTYVKCTLRGV